MLRLTLIRHGETEANVKRQLQGQTDSPLTENGHAQCKALAQRFRDTSICFTHMYISDLGRAQTSASYIHEFAFGRSLDPRLREKAFGNREFAASGNEKSESWQDVNQRIRSFLMTVLTRHGSPESLNSLDAAGVHVAAVSHGGWIHACAKMLHPKLATSGFGMTRNTGVWSFVIADPVACLAKLSRSESLDGHVRVEMQGDASHIERYVVNGGNTLDAFFHPSVSK
jgi:broad specificity phosphatase PhoE